MALSSFSAAASPKTYIVSKTAAPPKTSRSVVVSCASFSSREPHVVVSCASSSPREPRRRDSKFHMSCSDFSKGCRGSSSLAFKKVKQVAYISWDAQGLAEAQNIRDYLAKVAPYVIFKLGTRKCFFEEARAAGFSEENGTLWDITGSLLGTDLVLLSDAVPSWICREVLSCMKPNSIIVIPDGCLLDVACYVEFPKISVVTLCPSGHRLHSEELHEKGGIDNHGVVVYQDADGRAGDVAIGFLTVLDSVRKSSYPPRPINGNADEYLSHCLPTCRKRQTIAGRFCEEKEFSPRRIYGNADEYLSHCLPTCRKRQNPSGAYCDTILLMGMITLMNLALVVIGIRGHCHTTISYASSNGTISKTYYESYR